MVNTKRNTIFFIMFAMLTIFILNPIIVKADGLKVFDEANLLTADDISTLDNDANTLGNKYNMDIVIVTIDDAEGKDSREFADDYYDYNGFKADGILFLIDMDNSEVYISTSGQAIKYITDERNEKILDTVFDSGIGDGDYYNSIKGFLSSTQQYLEAGIPSDQFSEDEKADNSLSLLDGIISVISGAFVSGGFFLKTKSKYKMKNLPKPLNFRSNSIVNFGTQEDRLVDTFMTQRIIPKSNDNNNSSSSGKSTTHTSSSGNTHGGGGRKF